MLAACAVALPAVAHAQGASASGNPAALQGNGMWIWVMGASHRGSIPAIVAQARRSNIRTLFIKSGDGRNYWRQFTPALVSALHRAGLRVCAWQYVYGSYPVIEAQVGAQAVRNGADCLVIDAESEYEGRYVSAYSYVSTLRRLVGATYPISLAGFPYVHFHPGFPYSVFLGPAGRSSTSRRCTGARSAPRSTSFVTASRTIACTSARSRPWARPTPARRPPRSSAFARSPRPTVRRA